MSEEPADIFDVLGASVADMVNLAPRPGLAPYVGHWRAIDASSVLELRSDGSFVVDDEWVVGSGSWKVDERRLVLDGRFAFVQARRARGGSSSPSPLKLVIEHGPPHVEVRASQLVLRSGEREATFQRR
jgi:hypothetical protein